MNIQYWKLSHMGAWDIQALIGWGAVPTTPNRMGAVPITGDRMGTHPIDGYREGAHAISLKFASLKLSQYQGELDCHDKA